MEELKKLLGEELFGQVVAKLGDHKVDIVSDGNWIPKDKFNSVNEDLKEMKKQISDRDKQLKELGEKAKDNETLNQEIEKLKELNQKEKEQYEKRIADKEFDYNLEGELTKSEARNVKAVKALLDLQKVKLSDGKFEGLEDQLKTLKEAEPYLFGKDTLSGRQPNNTGSSGFGVNPWSKDTFNLTKQGEILRSNPELAKSLQQQATK